MPSPCLRRGGYPSAAFALVALAGWGIETGWSTEPTVARDAIRSTLPRYDPHVRESYVAAQAAATAKAPQTTANPIQSTPSTEPIVTLPRIIVRPGEKKDPPVGAALPRLRVGPVAKDLPPDEFLTPEANTARLVEKHLSALDRFVLNRFRLFGESKESRATKAEAIEHAAVQLNTIVDVLQMESGQPRDPAEEKRLKELYYDVYVSRPK